MIYRLTGHDNFYYDNYRYLIQITRILISQIPNWCTPNQQGKFLGHRFKNVVHSFLTKVVSNTIIFKTEEQVREIIYKCVLSQSQGQHI